MKFNRIEDIDLDGKTVLTRVDLNVPMENGQVSDATRIEKIIPTVKAIQAAGGKPVLLAHFGRPKGQRVDTMSLRQIIPALEAALGQPVTFAEEAIGGPAKRAVAAMGPGDVLLLENTRFYPGEEANDPTFAASLAALGQVYVNDAFSAAHRAHASTEG
ncbi:MAG: phosphoglycerate kinase, partial [Paracoccus sp. (in: a-proteobacteria)]|nr:phosphoglycerate kinase [Paracoccus sp. (in: a-proteobacteria)]